MANEIRVTYDTGATLYTLVFNAAGQVWRNNAPQQFLAYAPGAIGVYDIPLSEIATNSGQYRATWPNHANMIAGVYSMVLFLQAGGAPAVADDSRIGDTGLMYWDGSAEIDHSTIAAQLTLIGVGTGAVSQTYTVTDVSTGNPIDGVTVWMTTDIGGANVVNNGTTNAAGQFTFNHDYPSGTTLYVWRQLAGWNFDNPDSEVTT